MDGCTGIDGWYVDDIKVQSCNTKKEVLKGGLRGQTVSEGAWLGGALFVENRYEAAFRRDDESAREWGIAMLC